jgi:hypothetical protein
LTSVDLPEPDTPVTQVSRPTAMLTSTSFRLLPEAPGHHLSAADWNGDAVRFGTSMRRRPTDTAPVSDSALALTSAGVPWRDHSAAMFAGAQAHVDDVVGLMMASWSCSTTMTELPMSRRRRSMSQQARVIALVQPDRRFVEHIHHAGEPGADLAGEPDALRFAAGQRVRRTVERQVIQADMIRKRSRLRISPAILVGDGLFAPDQRHFVEELQRVSELHVADPMRRSAAPKPYVPGLDTQAGASASPGRSACSGISPVRRAPTGESVSRWRRSRLVITPSKHARLSTMRPDRVHRIGEADLVLPDPCSTASRTCSGSSPNGVSMSKP